ncbi:DUF302 domain-containing protein [Arthrobacter sp. BL-252-APC-1A]|uniref:DUF302 domain-containing protein n=1 Tax=Arthrobacter sp. BL-252-APC-1A TaxID=2606622 RepID=UPI0018A6C2FC|nr:DUF302 domain-containing protein [Arthrobacter sp. BL-252-APC-1A]
MDKPTLAITTHSAIGTKKSNALNGPGSIQRIAGPRDEQPLQGQQCSGKSQCHQQQDRRPEEEPDLRAQLNDSDFAAQLGASAPDWMLGYRILGTCNTALAGEAMELDRAIGVAVPCNVVIREDPGGAVSVIEALNPESLVDLAGQEQLAQVVSRTSDGLQAAMHTLSESAGPV